MKVISVDVYRSKRGDCSNGGITSKFDELDLYSDINNFKEYSEIPVDSLVLIKRVLFDKNCDYVIPYTYSLFQSNKVISGNGMFGGCFVYSSDSRYRELCNNPLPVHDRIEW